MNINNQTVTAAKRNKSRTTHAVLLVLASLLLMTAATSCQTAYQRAMQNLGYANESGELNAPKFDALAIVVGDVANSPRPALPEELKTEIGEYLAVSKVDSVPVVQSQGSPEVKTLPFTVKYDATNYAKIEKDFQSQLDNFEASLGGLKPTEDGADFLEAIKTADLALKSAAGSPKNPLIVVIGSGLSDSGILNFAEGNFLNSKPETVIDQVKGKLKTSDLEGDNIIWVNCGETSSPQLPLSSDSKRDVQTIYEQAFQKMGARSRTFQSIIPAGGFKLINNPGGKVVKTTDIPSGDMDWSSLSMTFDDQMLGGFITGSSDFKDPSLAQAALGSLVDLLKVNQGVEINVEGAEMLDQGKSKTTSSPLAQARADAVAKLLTEKGVASNRISTSNVGNSKAQGTAVESDKKVVITFN